MDAKNSVLLWNPGTDQVVVLAKPLEGRGAGYSCSSLGCYADFQVWSFEKRKLQVFIEAMHLIVRDGCDPMAVHRALCDLDEYQDGLSEDMPGAGRVTP